ncbi:MAG: mucoidy inhibitor MuiA family protein [Bacteroidota bacterium]
MNNMKIRFTLLNCLLFSSLIGQSPQKNNGTIAVDSRIERVTVFLQGAQIQRTADLNLKAGMSSLVFEDISPYLQDNSIQFSAAEELTILSINYQAKKEQNIPQEEELKKIRLANKVLSDSLNYFKTLVDILKEEERFLKEHAPKEDKSKAYDFEAYQSTSDYYSDKIRRLKLETYTINQEIKKINERLHDNRAKMRQLTGAKKEIPNRITIKVMTKKDLATAIKLSYLTKRASWKATYDIKAKDISQPIQLLYKAKLKQQTGEDWENALLTFSNANPDQKNVISELNPYYINVGLPANANLYRNNASYQENTLTGRVLDADSGEPLIGASVFIKGTNVGTVTDVNGCYTLNSPLLKNGTIVVSYTGFSTKEVAVQNSSRIDIPIEEGVALDEVVVTGYGRISNSNRQSKSKEAKPERTGPPTTINQKQTTVEFQLDVPYSIPSDGEENIIELAAYEVPTSYQYESVPKLEEIAYLSAEVTEWYKYNLLSGSANLYFENTFIGKSEIDISTLSDTLSLSLGRDRNVQIKRERNRIYQKKNLVGSKKTESRDYSIIIRNNKSVPVNIIVFDQIPVSTNKEIEIEDVAYAKNAKLDKDKGLLRWEIALGAQEEQALFVRYKVKYPKSKYVFVE